MMINDVGRRLAILGFLSEVHFGVGNLLPWKFWSLRMVDDGWCGGELFHM